MYLASEKNGIPLEDFPRYIEKLKSCIDELLGEIRYWRSEKESALEKCQITEKLLQEFKNSRPMFDANQKKKRIRTSKKRDKYKIDLDRERIWKRKEEEYKWSISEPLLQKVNRELRDRTSDYIGQDIIKYRST